MKNKRAKQMIADVILQGRAAFWYQEMTEIYAASSLREIEEEFGEPEEFPDDWGNLISSNWKYFWQMQLGEYCEATSKRRGRVVKDSDGNVNHGWELLPLICAVYGEAGDVVQISTGDY